MPYFQTGDEILIYPDEYVDACSKREIDTLKKILGVKDYPSNDNDTVGIRESQFNEAITNIEMNYIKLSEEDISKIFEIAKKL